MTESTLVVKSKNRMKISFPLVVLSLTLASVIFIGTSVMPFELVNGQNATGQNATGQNATGKWKMQVLLIRSILTCSKHSSPGLCK